MYAKRAVSAWGQPQIECGVISLLGTRKGFYSFGIFMQTFKTEILEADDAPIGHSCQVHTVIPDIKIILHPFVTIQIACNTRRIVSVGWKAEYLESF